MILFKSRYTNPNDTLGNATSVYNKVFWQRKGLFAPTISQPISQQKFNPPVNSQIENSKIVKMAPVKSAFYPSLFFNNNLEYIKNEVDSSYSFETDGKWEAFISEDDNGRIKLADGKIKKSMLMDPYDSASGMIHTHNVFEEVSFKNIVITLEFDDSLTTSYIHKLYLDGTSISSASNITNLPKPDELQIYRSVGLDGKLGEVEDYQMGISQLLFYYVKCGDKLLELTIQLSFVFMYPRADFDPGGVVLANKFYPQIEFSAKAMLPPESNKYSIYKDITSSLPSTVDPLSAKVTDYSARVKMLVNNNSSHHISPTAPFSDGFRRDGSHLKKFREEYSEPTKIPKEFEKIILDDYISASGKVKGNIIGFYTDSNLGSVVTSGSSDENRLKPNYKFDPALFDLGEKFAAQASPFWENIFDYASYNVEYEKEFIAVYGSNSKKIDPLCEIEFTEFRPKPILDEGTGKIVDTKLFNYPDTSSSSTNQISLKKMPRQGAYDNIHLQGYLGHYKDNQKLVIHAPICGYCCFHMHWRWSSLNFEVAKDPMFNMGNHGFDLSHFLLYRYPKTKSIVNENSFLGWDENQSHSYPYDEQSRGKGMPLIPPNQQLKIAVTHPDTLTPFSEEYAVIDTGSSTTALDLEIKAIWYSVNIENTGFDTSQVIMEHGCGYAVDYSDDAKVNIHGNSIAWTRQVVRSCVESILAPELSVASDPSKYEKFLSAIKYEIASYMQYISPGLYPIPLVNPVFSPPSYPQPTSLKYHDMYELLYRLMHFYNAIKDVSSPTDPLLDYDQIPTNHSSDTNAAYPNLHLMEKL